MGQITATTSELIPLQALDAFCVNYYTRKNGTFCADIKVRSPITGNNIVKQVTAKSNEDILQKRVIAAMETLYRKIRPDFLRCALLTNDITLRHYLELDLSFLKDKWPKSYSEKEYSALLSFADRFTRPIPDCSNADDFFNTLSGLNFSHELEVTVLRMVRDIVDELVKLGLYHANNPISGYYAAANSTIRQEKRTQRNISSMSLPQSVVHNIYMECLERIQTDPRYLAIPLRAIGLTTDIIAALNFEDIIHVDGKVSILIRAHLVKGNLRFGRQNLTNEWKFRLLPMDFLKEYIEFWKIKYTHMGVADVEKAPLCAAGCRKHPKRCAPEEMEVFLSEIIKRHIPIPPEEMLPSSKNSTVEFEYHALKISSQCLHGTFLACGADILEQDPLAARYMLGQEPLTVDEKVYTDRTHPLQQLYMGDMIVAILHEMGVYKVGD